MDQNIKEVKGEEVKDCSEENSVMGSPTDQILANFDLMEQQSSQASEWLNNLN